jgi:hypothetical protein
VFACLSGIILCSSGHAQAPADTPAQPPAIKAAPSAERLNQLAHQLLAAAVKSNGLAGDGLKPWHLKVDFQMLASSSDTKPVSGAFEEWYADRYHWRRTYSSSKPEWNGSEWHAGKAHRYVLNCTSLAHPVEQYGLRPEWVVPTMCFDNDLHVRLMRSESIAGQFYDLQPFQGRNVARDVKLIVAGRVWCEMKVTLLETIDKVDEALLKPDADATERPFMLDGGDPQPVPTYQVGASIPLVTGYPPYRGSMAFPVIIRKDGSVKVEGTAGYGPIHYIWDAISTAVSRWKYQPYVVEGEPVEVEFRVIYNVDGKPFVPVVERQ